MALSYVMTLSGPKRKPTLMGVFDPVAQHPLVMLIGVGVGIALALHRPRRKR